MESRSGDRQSSAAARRMLDRVVGLYRERAAPATAPRAPQGRAEDASTERSAERDARLLRIEASLEALQDQVYREAERHDQELATLRHELRPSEIARSLNDDARRRGL